MNYSIKCISIAPNHSNSCFKALYIVGLEPSNGRENAYKETIIVNGHHQCDFWEVTIRDKSCKGFFYGLVI